VRHTLTGRRKAKAKNSIYGNYFEKGYKSAQKIM